MNHHIIKNDLFIRHETQDSLLCGQHCLNNLLQQSIFNPINLSDIAQELDLIEMSLMSSPVLMRSESTNCDASGNFGIEVLKCAMKRYNNIELISWYGSEGRSVEDLVNEKGFILNKHHHWFAIRKIGNNWWNLDSTLEKPLYVSPFYLTAFLSQMKADGFSVFIAKGDLPPGGEYNYDDSEVGVIWYTEQTLLTKSTSRESKETQSYGPVQYSFNSADDEDLMLAQALSASLTDK